MRKKITWIIPMAGKGMRTSELGEFKPFIEIRNKKIIYWFLLSIKNLIQEDDDLVFITTEYFSDKFNVNEELKKILNNQNIRNTFWLIETPPNPRGQSETILFSKDAIADDSRVIIINPDQYIDFSLPEEMDDFCYLGLYLNLGNKSGFVNIEEGLITNFVEKKNISNLASAGICIVPKFQILLNAINEQIENNEMTNNEFYLGSAFNYMIKKGIKIKPFAIRAKYDLGNIPDIKIFEKNIAEKMSLSANF